MAVDSASAATDDDARAVAQDSGERTERNNELLFDEPVGAGAELPPSRVTLAALTACAR